MFLYYSEYLNYETLTRNYKGLYNLVQYTYLYHGITKIIEAMPICKKYFG